LIIPRVETPQIEKNSMSLATGVLSNAYEQRYGAHLGSPMAVLQMIQGFWVSRALYVAVALGVSDLLKDGAKSTEDLASATCSHAPSLYRVLRARGRLVCSRKMTRKDSPLRKSNS